MTNTAERRSEHRRHRRDGEYEEAIVVEERRYGQIFVASRQRWTAAAP